MQTPKPSDRLAIINVLFIVLMLIMWFVPVPSLVVRIALAITSLVVLALSIVILLRGRRHS